MEYEDSLNIIVFVFTILIVGYAITKGMDLSELTMNVIYFTVLILQQVNILLKMFDNEWWGKWKMANKKTKIGEFRDLLDELINMIEVVNEEMDDKESEMDALFMENKEKQNEIEELTEKCNDLAEKNEELEKKSRWMKKCGLN